MISRNTICKELNIDSKTLEQYLSFMAYPEPRDDSFESNVAHAVYKLHELTYQGFSLNEIRDLIHCSEKFCHVIPSLKEFLQLSESINLRETINSYDEIFQEFSSREEQYQYRIQELESESRSLRSNLDRASIQEERASGFQNEYSNIRNQANEKDLYISNLKMRISELEIQNSDLRYELNNQRDEMENIKDMISSNSNRNKSAIDVSAILRKKEKEVSLKYQREILDLKKQVEFMLENQEQKWLKRNLSPHSSSK
jgi:chromosome segregation ATPase